MKVTEEEHEVVEKEIDTYVCDRCGNEMGTEPDHDIAVNPRLKVINESSAATTRTDKTIETVTEVGDRASPHGDRILEKQDDEMEWCASCVHEVFPVGVRKSVGEQAEQVKEDNVSGLVLLLLLAVLVGLLLVLLL